MPDTTTKELSDLKVLLVRNRFFDAGQDGFTQPPSQHPDLFEKLENFLPSIDGVLRKRWGMSRFDGGTAISLEARNITEFRLDNGTKERLIFTGEEGATRKVKSSDPAGEVKNTGLFTVVSTTEDPRNVTSRDFTYFTSEADNDRVKWDGDDTAGNGMTTWGFAAATTALSASSSGSGTMTITAWRDYTVVFENTNTGQISDLATDGSGDFLFTRVTKFSKKAQVDLTSIPTGVASINSINTGINQRVILATSDGGPRSRLYKVGVIADNSTTTFTDSVEEDTLLANNLYVEIGEDGLKHGCIDNARPPSGRFPVKHRGRLFILDDRKLRFSKSQEEVSTSTTFEIGGRYEECWPASYELDVSSIAQDLVGLLSDGVFLYILAKSSLYRLQGEGPLTFRPPELVFKYIGVQSQDTVDVIYQEGIPTGFIWITPNKEVILSDGNTYENITWPVKTEMDDIPAAQLNNVRVKFGNYEGHNLAMIAVPQAGDTFPILILVYNIDRRRWAKFKFPATQKVTAMHFWHNPTTNLSQILWSIDGEKMYEFDSAKTTDLTSADATTSFTSEAITSWQDFDASNLRKHLNAIEVMGSVANVLVSIHKATTSANFESPAAIITDTALVTAPLGQSFVALASKTTRERFYRFGFKITGNLATTTAAIRAYSIEAALLGTD